jgi:hypothetical protein
MGMGLVFWGIDDRIKANTVPHGDVDFLFVVIVLYKIGFAGVPLALCQCGQQQNREDKVVD